MKVVFDPNQRKSTMLGIANVKHYFERSKIKSLAIWSQVYRGNRRQDTPPTEASNSGPSKSYCNPVDIVE